MLKLVADANILFSMFRPDSVTNQIVAENKIMPYSPSFALDELKKYEQEIVNKSRISNFNDALLKIENIVNFIPRIEYSNYLAFANKIIEDKKDTDYVALALKLSIPIWSNDKDLKKQKEVICINTTELIYLI